MNHLSSHLYYPQLSPVEQTRTLRSPEALFSSWPRYVPYAAEDHHNYHQISHRYQPHQEPHRSIDGPHHSATELRRPPSYHGYPRHIISSSQQPHTAQQQRAPSHSSERFLRELQPHDGQDQHAFSHLPFTSPPPQHAPQLADGHVRCYGEVHGQPEQDHGHGYGYRNSHVDGYGQGQGQMAGQRQDRHGLGYAHGYTVDGRTNRNIVGHDTFGHEQQDERSFATSQWLDGHTSVQGTPRRLHSYLQHLANIYATARPNSHISLGHHTPRTHLHDHSNAWATRRTGPDNAVHRYKPRFHSSHHGAASYASTGARRGEGGNAGGWESGMSGGGGDGSVTAVRMGGGGSKTRVRTPSRCRAIIPRGEFPAKIGIALRGSMRIRVSTRLRRQHYNPHSRYNKSASHQPPASVGATDGARRTSKRRPRRVACNGTLYAFPKLVASSGLRGGQYFPGGVRLSGPPTLRGCVGTGVSILERIMLHKWRRGMLRSMYHGGGNMHSWQRGKFGFNIGGFDAGGNGSDGVMGMGRVGGMMPRFGSATPVERPWIGAGVDFGDGEVVMLVEGRCFIGAPFSKFARPSKRVHL